METLNIYAGQNPEVQMTERLRALFVDPKIKANIQPFEMQKSKAIGSSDLDFDFKLGQDRGETNVLDNSLSDNDAFVLVSMAIGLAKVDNDFSASFERIGNVYPVFYPDPNIFDGAATGANVSEASALESVYRGFLKAQSDVNEVLFRLNTERFRKVARTQQNTDPNFPLTTNNYFGQQYEELSLPVLFEGQSSNEFQFKAAPKSDKVQANGEDDTKQNYLIFFLRGVIIRQYATPATIQEIRNAGLVGTGQLGG